MDITLEDFFNLTKIELHMFSFEINKYKLEDISYLTHPKLNLLTAVQMTCGLPILITPVCIDNGCYIDGGMACNYPLSYCINSGKESDEILGFKNKYNDIKKKNITNESSILDFILSFLFKAICSISINDLQPKIKNEICCEANYLTIELLQNSLSNIEIRRDLFKNGINTAENFLSELKNCV
jgi:predicted acylesterase/phospholipase RssA